MSTTTWNSDLLSNGSIFSTTSPSTGSASDDRDQHGDDQRRADARLRPPRRASSNGRNMRSKNGADARGELRAARRRAAVRARCFSQQARAATA